MHAVGMRAAGGLEESQYAPEGTRLSQVVSEKEERHTRNGHTLSKIAKDIIIVKKGLEEEGASSSWLSTLGEIAERVSNALNASNTLKGVEERL